MNERLSAPNKSKSDEWIQNRHCQDRMTPVMLLSVVGSTFHCLKNRREGSDYFVLF